MDNALFLQSDIADPYALYDTMLASQPVRYDERNRLWVVYSHAACRQLLQASTTHIPPLPPAPLNGTVATLAGRLARLSNPPRHAAFRQAAMHLFTQMTPAFSADLLARLLGTRKELDWVEAVCKKLPVLAVMEGFGFADTSIAFVLDHIEAFTKIMLPHKTEQQIAQINAIAPEMLALARAHLQQDTGLRTLGEDERITYACNLIGLLIQSHDAGRGLLSNALLQTLAHRPAHESDWRAMVVETLRFDSPIHNTRRVLTEDMEIGGKRLKQGDAVLLVLAAANRDPAVFSQPAQFDAARANNGEHLSFGAGTHMCAAQHFAVKLAADALAALFADDREVQLMEPALAYEPMVNARLPRRMRIRLV